MNQTPTKIRKLDGRRVRMALRVLDWLERPKDHARGRDYLDALSEARYAAIGMRSPCEAK